MKEKILILTGGYFPAKKYGGPPISVANIIASLSDDFDFYILTSDHELKSSEKLEGIEEGWNQVKEAKVKYISDNDFNSGYIKDVLVELKPSLIYIQSFFSKFFLLPTISANRNLKIPLLVAPRGELLEGAINSGNAFSKLKKLVYTILMKNILNKKYTYFQGTSEEETQEIKQRFKNFKIIQLENLTISSDVDIYQKKEKNSEILYACFISRIVRKKNLITAIKSLKDLKGNVIFSIYGPIEDEDYWNECKDEIKKLSKNIVVNYRGILNHDEIGNVFFKNQVFLFPTYSENYGHVIAESINSLCPVITTVGTPWTDLGDSEAGWIVNPDDDREIHKILSYLLEMDSNAYLDLIKKLKEYKEIKVAGYEQITSSYKNGLKGIIEKKYDK